MIMRRFNKLVALIINAQTNSPPHNQCPQELNEGPVNDCQTTEQHGMRALLIIMENT